MKRSAICLIVLFAGIFCGFAQTIVSMGGGISHNSIYQEPKPKQETVPSLHGPISYPYPSWNYFITAGMEYYVFEKMPFFISSKIEFDKYKLVYKTDSSSARVYIKYFPDPAIKVVYNSSSLSVPLSIGYNYKKRISVEFGLKISFISWEHQKSYLLSGKTIELDPSRESKFYIHWIAAVFFDVYKLKEHSLRIGMKYEHRPYVGYELGYLKLALIYRLPSLKKT